MPYPYAFSIALAQPGARPEPWLPAPDPASITRLQDRRARILQACVAARPGLEPRYLALHDLVELLEPDDAAGPGSAAQALARYQRYLDLSCARPYGRIGLQLFDTLAVLEVELDDPRQWQPQRPVLQQDLAALLGALAQADGLQVTPAPRSTGRAASAQAQAGAVLDMQAPHAAKRARKSRALAWQARLGRPLLAFAGVLAAALTFWLALDAHRLGTLSRMTDASRPLPFINDHLEEARTGWALFPTFVLHGHVQTDDPRPVVVEAAVRVHRNVALRTGNGARYTVLPTRDPAQPYVLRNDHDDVGAVLALGRHGLHWSAALALLPLPLWYACMVRPWRAATRADAALQSHARHAVVKAWGSVLLWAAAIAVVIGARLWFG